MIDYFALLGFPRSASLDAAELKHRFHEVAASEHPDVSGGSGFAQLNVAYRALSDPKTRLAHLLELNGSNAAGISEPPPDLVDLFFDVAAAVRLNDATLLSRLIARSEGKRAEVLRSLNNIDANDVAALRIAHQRLAFLDRWLEQLHEATFRCSM